MRKRIIAPLALLLLTAAYTTTRAQELANYTLTLDTLPFHSLAGTGGGHPLAAVTGDNGEDYTTLPFDFPFGESLVTSGTRVRVNSNGYIHFGNSAPGDYGYSVWGNQGLTYQIIIPFLIADGYCGAPAGQGAWWADTTDADGQRVFLVEIRQIAPYYGRSDAANNVSFQIGLYEDGTVSVHFDSSSYVHTSSCNLVLANGNADKVCLEGSWGQPSTGTPASIPSLQTAPPAGARYTFRRPADFCARPQLLAVDSVSATSVGLSWRGEAAQYGVWYTASDTGWTDYTTTSDTAITLGGLESSTHYSFAVVSLCDDSTFSSYAYTDTRTSCAPIADLPFTEDFEGFSIGASGWDPCWTRFFRENAQTLNTANPIGTSDAHDGNRAIRLYAHANYGQWTLFALPEVEAPLGTLQLSFYHRSYRSNNNLLQVGVMTNPTDTGSFIPLDTVDASNTDWALAEVDLSAYTGSARNVAIRYSTSATSGYDTYYLFIDDLMLGVAPSCPRPAAVAADSVTTSGARLTVADSAATYSVSVASADTAFSLWIVGDTVAYLTDLLPQTDYSVSVARQCDDGTMTRPVATSFRTPCEALTHADLPYADNFNSYSQWGSGFDNPCWTTLNFNTGGYGSLPGISAYTRHGSTGNSLYFSAYRTGEGQYAALPAVDFIGDLALTFFAYASTQYATLEVGVMTDPYDTATFIPVRTVVPSQAQQWEEQVITFDTFTASNLHIAFRNSQQGGMTVTAHQYHIDDLSLDLAPACAHPASASLSNATATTLVLTVSDPDAVGTYRVYMDGDSIDIYDTLYTLTALQPGTTYAVSVAAVCSNGLPTSSVSAVGTTLCLPIDSTLLPWSENFEGWPTGNYADFPVCWDRHFGYVGNWSAYVESKVKAVPDGSRTAIYMQGAYAMQEAMLVLPEVSHDLRLLQLSVRMRFNSGYGQSTSGLVEVGVLDSLGDPSTFRPVDSILNAAGGSQYAVHDIPLLACGSASGRIALRYNNQDPNDYDYAYIDSLALTAVLDSLPVVVEPVTLILDTAICAGSALAFGDTTLATAGTYTRTSGDTTTVLTLALNPTYSDTMAVEAQGSYRWNDSTFTVSTLFTLRLTTVDGCDSTLTLDLTLTPEPQPVTFTLTVSCDPLRGTVTGSGSHPEGSQVVITATGLSGYHFKEWAEDHVEDSVRTVTLTSDTTFTALFEANPVIGIDGVTLANVSLYPNPAATEVTLTGLEGAATVTLIDQSGRSVGEWKVERGEWKADVSGLARGAYFVRIATDSATAVKKLIVR